MAVTNAAATTNSLHTHMRASDVARKQGVTMCEDQNEQWTRRQRHTPAPNDNSNSDSCDSNLGVAGLLRCACAVLAAARWGRVGARARLRAAAAGLAARGEHTPATINYRALYRQANAMTTHLAEGRRVCTSPDTRPSADNCRATCPREAWC